MCNLMYAYVCVYIYTYVYTYTCMCIQGCLYVYLSVLYLDTYIQTNTCTHMYIHIFICICACACLQACLRACMCTQTYAIWVQTFATPDTTTSENALPLKRHSQVLDFLPSFLSLYSAPHYKPNFIQRTGSRRT